MEKEYRATGCAKPDCRLSTKSQYPPPGELRVGEDLLLFLLFDLHRGRP